MKKGIQIEFYSKMRETGARSLYLLILQNKGERKEGRGGREEGKEGGREGTHPSCFFLREGGRRPRGYEEPSRSIPPCRSWDWS